MLSNDAITNVVGDLFDQRINPYFARLASYFETSSSWRAACNEHSAIRDCIAKADPAGARAAMQAHLERSQERFTRTFGDALPVTPEQPAARPNVRPMKSTQARPKKPKVNTGRK